ncbi:hypothetical protein ACFQYP_57225 [Nonomuraea antimicrobica]
MLDDGQDVLALPDESDGLDEIGGQQGVGLRAQEVGPRGGRVPLENTISCSELGFCCAIRAAAATIARCCYRLSTGW